MTAAKQQTSTLSHRPHSHEAARPHETWPSRRTAALCYAAFTVYAGLLAVFSAHEDRAWAVWGAGSYAIATLLLRFGRRWWPGLAVALGGGLVAPFLWLVTQAQDTAEVRVIGRSAAHLLKYGTPYLPASQLSDWTRYNPYLPVMEIFGLPRSAGLHGILGDPRVWTSLATLVLGAMAFAVMSPHGVRACRSCRQHVARLTVLSVAAPVIAFPLALGITDPPLIALICLTLACVSRGWLVRAGIVIAAACAMKYTAWPVVPVLAVMLWVRYAPRAASRFTATALASAGMLALLAAPEAMAQPDSVMQNTVAFPLGLTKHKTPAASPLPGHLLASLGPAGHAAAVAAMGVSGLAFVAWLLLRPPKTAQAVAWRLAVGYAVMFTLAPATRFGYFAYPLCLLGWLCLTGGYTPTPRTPRPLRFLAVASGAGPPTAGAGSRH